MSGSVVRRSVVVQGKEGLHLRAAALFVQVANRFPSLVRVQKAGLSANGKSIMELLTLAAEEGSELILEAEGDGALEALEALAPLLESREPGAASGSEEIS